MSTSARRSQRLLKKRNASHSATDPAPGAYSAYDDGYVVESEASFLPPPDPVPESRRARYQHSPHRLVDSSPAAAPDPDADADAGIAISPQTPPNAQRRPRAASAVAHAADPSVVDRVSASLFDILGSATRRPVNSTYRPRRATAPTLPRVDEELADDGDGDNDDDVVPSDDEADAGMNASRPAAPPLRSHQPMVFSPAPRNRRARGSAAAPRPPLAPTAPSAPIAPSRAAPRAAPRTAPPARAARAAPTPRVSARGGAPRLPAIRPVPAVGALLCLALAVLLGLDAMVCARRARETGAVTCTPFARRLIPGVPRLAVGMPSLPSLSCGQTCLNWRAAAAGLLLRFGSRPALVAFRASDDAPKLELPADVVTRAQLAGEFEPRVLAAARKAAEQEAARVLEEAAAAAAAAKAQAGDAGAESIGTADVQETQTDADEDKETDKTSGERAAEEEEAAFARFVERYAADKDLPADFALGSAGGAVIGSEPSALLEAARFARAYAASVVSTGAFTPVWPVGAGEVIRPSVLPGNCWSFRGDRGSVTIRLARPVRVSGVTVEHTPQRSVFSVRAAVRAFRVVALPLGGGADAVLGDFEFEVGDGKRHLQTFAIADGETEVVVARAVRFEVESNHGAGHTAIYRLRVHGEQVELDERGQVVG